MAYITLGLGCENLLISLLTGYKISFFLQFTRILSVLQF